MLDRPSRRALSLFVPIALALSAPAAVLADPAPMAAPVVTTQDLGGDASGRLLVFAQRIEPGAPAQEEVDTSAFNPTGTAIAARAVAHLPPGTTALAGTEADSSPTPRPQQPPGNYRLPAGSPTNPQLTYWDTAPVETTHNTR